MAYADITYGTKNGVKAETSRKATYPTWPEYLGQVNEDPKAKKKDMSAAEILDAMLNH